MAEIKDPKRFYYAMRSRYLREAKQTGHKLSLAVSDEEDALLWEKYKKIMERYRALKAPEGVRHEPAVREHTFLKPVFNAEYIELTHELKGLYANFKGVKSEAERLCLEEKIRRLKRRRMTVTDFVDRETGDIVSPEK